jgi:hypothetical protein
MKLRSNHSTFTVIMLESINLLFMQYLAAYNYHEKLIIKMNLHISMKVRNSLNHLFINSIYQRTISVLLKPHWHNQVVLKTFSQVEYDFLLQNISKESLIEIFHLFNRNLSLTRSSTNTHFFIVFFEFLVVDHIIFQLLNYFFSIF